MKTLIIHHLEPEWKADYIGANWTFDQLCEAVAAHIEDQHYDHVILTQFNPTVLNDHYEYEPLFGMINEIYEYGYGWEIDEVLNLDNLAKPISRKNYWKHFEMIREGLEDRGYIIDKYGTTWALGGDHSEVVRIDDWMTDLPKEGVDICGAFDNACIQDLEMALNHLDIKFNRIEGLII